MQNEKEDDELIWGSIKVKDLLKHLYKGKNIDRMSAEELEQFVDDFI